MCVQRSKTKEKLAVYGLVTSCAFLPQLALAADWETSASVSAGGVYTDNVGLDENNKDSELITVVNPSFTLKGSGRRANIDAVASFQFNDLDGDADNFSPQGRVNADVELLENLFFVEGAARAAQTVINPFAAAGTQLNTTGNVTTTYDYSITPYIVHSFKRFATFRAEYTYDEQSYDGGSLADSTSDYAEVSLSSGLDFGRLSWRLMADYEDTVFDDDPSIPSRNADNERTSTSARLGYQFDRKWQINTTVGKEWNTFESTRSVDTDDQFWDAGITWSPTERTIISAGYGERFFGSTPRFSLEHQNRRVVFSVDYQRSLTDTRSERGNFSPFPDQDIFGEDIDPDVADALRELLDNFTFEDQGIFVNESLNASLGFRGRRTTVTLTGKRSRQIRQDLNTDVLFLSYGISAERRLSSKLTLNSSLNWRSQEDQADFEYDTTHFSIGLTRQLGPNTDLELRYSYSDRDSDRANDTYDENRISLQFSIAL